MGTAPWDSTERAAYLALNVLLSILTLVSPILGIVALTIERAMRSTLTSRIRNKSISAVPPPQSSSEYSQDLARIARRIIYRSPAPSKAGYAIYILNAAAFPEAQEVDYDALLPYVLARLPEEDELISGTEYEVVFFAGGGEGSATRKSGRPSWAWFVQAYNVLSRAMRKRIKRLYIVHEKSWVRVLVEMFSTVVSPKFRKKVVHGTELHRPNESSDSKPFTVSTLSALALHLPLEELLVPPSAYLYDRRLSPDIHVPYVTGRRAFCARHPLPKSMDGRTRLPRVLRETTSFVLLPGNIKQEGIFRIPPHAKLNEILREAYDRSQRFIVWKEGDEALPLPKAYSKEGADRIIAQVDQIDAYGMASATGLIKTWYRELRQPLFPPSCYSELRRIFADREAEIQFSDLVMLTSPTAEVSPLPVISRTILTRHLLPLLDRVERHKDSNQMTALNLAICLAPTLICGPDQLEDMKISSLVSRYLEAAIESWDRNLRDACGLEQGAFEKEIRDPESVLEYDDPLDLQHSESDDQIKEDESQINGIILVDNDEIGDAPPLPPRRALVEQQSSSVARHPELDVRRRPAPSVEVPPRYSIVVQDENAALECSPTSYARTTDGFAPQASSTVSDAFADTVDGAAVEKGVGDPSTESTFAIPKRKALPRDTPTAPSSGEEADARSRTNTISRKPLVPPKPTPGQPAANGPLTAPPVISTPPNPITHPDSKATCTASSAGATPIIFAKPAWPASCTRSASLPAAPVPASSSSLSTVPMRKPSPRPGLAPESPAASLLPKPRTPSPGLLQRMPSFEAAPAPPKSSAHPALGLGASAPSVRRRVGGWNGGGGGDGDGDGEERSLPKRLVVRERSVDDLRRIYEERVGTVQGLVRAGSGKER